MYTEASATTIYFMKESNGTLARPAGTSAGGTWAFAVDYGDTTYVCVTWEEEGDVHIGLVDIAAGVDATGAWPIVSSNNLADLMSADLELILSGSVSDHWQIYAHGYHVITVAVGGRDLYLLAVTLDASLAFKIVTEVAVASSANTGFLVTLDTEARTNDHHCVIYGDTNTSVAVCVGSPIESTVGIAGHYVIEVNLSTGAVTALGEFGDATNARFNYESSTRTRPPPRRVPTPSTSSPAAPSTERPRRPTGPPRCWR